METGRISEGAGGSPGLLSSGSDKGESGQFSAENHIAHRGSDNHPEAGWESRFSVRFFMDLPESPGCPGGLAAGGISGSEKRVRKRLFQRHPYWPKTTAYMIRPGRKVNRPAMMSA